MSHLRNPFFLGATLLASLAFTYHYFLYTHEYPPGSYQRIAAYEADKVFQTRILVTTLANILEPTLPLLQATFHTIVPYPIDYEVLLQLLNVCFLSALLLSMPARGELLLPANHVGPHKRRPRLVGAPGRRCGSAAPSTKCCVLPLSVA